MGWRYRADNFTAPLDQSFLLRVQAPTSGGRYNGSAGLIETTRQFQFTSADVLGPEILADGFETR